MGQTVNKKRIRVLVVDDSRLIRELLSDALAEHPDMQVVGTAGDGQEALSQAAKLQPDIITLDLQMPRLGGLETLDKILESNPIPVIVVSSLTCRAADITLQALDRGAMDYVAKPEGMANMRRVFAEDLPTKIRSMVGTDVRRVLQFRKARALRAQSTAKAAPQVDVAVANFCDARVIAIGVSTGGPPALSTIFGSLLPPLPPIVIVQHMPPLFTGPFAGRLNALSALDVKEAQAGDVLRPNLVLVAPGGKHLSLVRNGGKVQVALADSDPVSGHKPSVDVMMQSAARCYGTSCLGVIMTGMGRDGVDGCAAIRAAGGFVLGQDEATSDVYGMNKAAFNEGHVNQQVALPKLAEAITSHALRGCPRTPARAVQPPRTLTTTS
jgi:two-component system chemotaxis response regulator CheB